MGLYGKLFGNDALQTQTSLDGGTPPQGHTMRYNAFHLLEVHFGSILFHSQNPPEQHTC